VNKRKSGIGSIQSAISKLAAQQLILLNISLSKYIRDNVAADGYTMMDKYLKRI